MQQHNIETMCIDLQYTQDIRDVMQYCVVKLPNFVTKTENW